MIRRGVGLERILEGQPQDLVDHLPARDVLPVDERDGDAARSCAPGAADAVEVGLLVVGAFVVDDVGDAVHVDAARGHIGGDEHVDLAVAEGAQSLLARPLTEVAVHGTDGEATLGELVGDLLGLALGPGEDHGESTPVGLEDAREELDLVHGVSTPHVLLDGIDRGAIVTGIRCADVGRLRHVAPREGDDLAGHRGGEEHRLPRGWELRDDALDVGEESHVEHFVGLVEDEDAHARQVERASLDQIDEATRRADDDLDTRGECLDLRLVGAAAVDAEHACTLSGTGLLEVSGDLHAQLARGHHDERLRRRARGVVALDALEERDAEAEGLARSGLGLADEVAALEGEGQCHGLDGERALDAGGGERRDDLRRGA